MAFRKYVLVCFLIILGKLGFSQIDTTEVLNKLCRGYLTAERQIIADTSYMPDSKGAIFTPMMAAYVRKRFLYQHILGRPTLMHPDRNAIPVLADGKMGCRLTFPGEAEAFVDIISAEEGLRVAGINGKIIDEAQIRYTDSLITSARVIAVDKKDLYVLTETFVQTANRFWEGGSSDALAPLCTPAYLTILKIGKEADSLVQHQRPAWQLNNQHIDWVGGDTAVAQLEVDYYGQVILYLIKKEEKWQVFGERGLIGNDENIALKRTELELLRPKAALRDAIQQRLNPALVTYFEQGNSDNLRQLSSDAFFQSMEKIKRKFGKLNPDFLKVKGVSIPVNLEEKVLLRNDTARVNVLDASLYFTRSDGRWRIFGFNQFVEAPATESYIEVNYESLLSFWGIEYSSLNDKTGEVYLPEPGEKDTMTYHYMTDFMFNEATPQLPGGLWTYMETQMKSNKRHEKKAPKYVYLSFHVENDGSLSETQVLQSPNKRKGKKAMKMLSQMPSWIPAEVDNQNVRMYRVLAVPVY